MAVKQKVQEASRTAQNGTRFVCAAEPSAKEVYVVGEFNNWNGEADRMVKRHGQFQKSLKLAPGEYEYKYLVDGKWYTDPDADQVRNAFGTLNNKIKVEAFQKVR